MKTKKTKATDDVLAELSGHALQHRLIDDAANKTSLFFTDDGVIRFYDGTGLSEPPYVVTTAPHASGHWSNLKHVQVSDLAAFFAGARRIDERAMAWWLGRGQSSHLYTEVIRTDRRVLLLWGGNNSRNLCHAGLTFDGDVSAAALVATFRAGPRKGFRATTPFFVEGKGGVRREYWPAPAEPTPRAQKWFGDVLGADVNLTLQCQAEGGLDFQRRGVVCTSVEEARSHYNAWELALFHSGGRLYEVEWMSGLQEPAPRTRG
jgi:hypothetical protein